MKLLFGMVVLTASLSATADEPKAKEKIAVELRWLEEKPIEGVTEKKGILASERENDFVYPHVKPALVLTKKEVSEVKLNKIDGTKNGLGLLIMVDIHLTKEAREKLAAGVKGKDTRLLTVTVDGKHWGVHRYEIDKDKPFVSDKARAETFRPSVGFFRVESEAQQVVDALK